MRSLGPHTRHAGPVIGTLLLVASLAVGIAHAQTADPEYVDTASNDVQVFNYLLNLEYLFAEFYTCAVTGGGLPAALRGGGPASIGCTQASLTGPVADFAAELAATEANHVAWLRNALGAAAVPIPPLDISAGSTGPVTLFAAESDSSGALGAWSDFVNTALGKTLNPPFTPYDSNVDFLIGAYILEDVMVTALEGQIRFVNASDYVVALEGLISAEGYHAGAVRELLIEQAGAVVPPYGLSVNQIAQAISNERAALDGTRSSNVLGNDDQWILNTTSNTPVLVPSNGYTFERTAWQTIQIFTLGASNGRGLFFPSGLNASKALNGTSKDIGLSVPPFTVNSTNDQSIFAFALNLEYLEADFYHWLVHGYRASLCPNKGTCPESIGAKQGNLSEPIFNLFAEICAHEYDHAAYFRSKAGPQAFPFQQLNFSTFAAIADAAMGRTLDPPFDPFADDMSALIAGYILEDVGVTAYKYAVPQISDRSYLRGGSGICALEAYHAGAIRMQLLQNSSAIIQPWGVDALTITQKISALRASASHAYDDIGVSLSNGQSTVVNGDANSLAWGRAPAQIVNIVTLGSGTGSGGFFPDGLVGVINGTAGSLAAASNLPPPLPAAAPALAPSPVPLAGAAAPSSGAASATPGVRGPTRSVSSGSSGIAYAPTATVATPTAVAPAASSAPVAALGSLCCAVFAAAAVAAAVLA